LTDLCIETGTVHDIKVGIYTYISRFLVISKIIFLDQSTDP